jgi:hypothetical protein
MIDLLSLVVERRRDNPEMTDHRPKTEGNRRPRN